MINLDVFDGHIVLLCKYHYKVDDFFKALAQLWAIRCGYDYKDTPKDVYVNIANRMYRIIKKTEPQRLNYLMELIHKGVDKDAFYKPQNMTPIQAIIWEYREILLGLTTHEKTKNGEWKTLVKLPEPQKEIFKRIFSDGGQYTDYNLLKNVENLAELKKVS